MKKEYIGLGMCVHRPIGGQMYDYENKCVWLYAKLV
jgi:hypothetical protein